jgi:hypothetical protein
MSESVQLAPARHGLLRRVVASASAVASGRALHERRRRRKERKEADEEILRSDWISPLLAWRVNEIVTREHRLDIARSLRKTVQGSDGKYLPGASPVDRSAVRGQSDELLEIAARLESNRPVGPRGVLLVERLLKSAASPLYAGTPTAILPLYLDEIFQALEGRGW